jgi:hypothetical protein
LRLKNEHYTLIRNEGRSMKICFLQIGNKKTFRIYRYNSKTNNIDVYNGKEITSYPRSEFTKTKNNAINDRLVYLSDCDNKRRKKENGDKVDLTIQETYDYICGEYDKLLELSEGKINLYKFQSIQAAASYYWDFMSKHIKQPEPQDKFEEYLIEKNIKGGLLYAKQGYEGYAISYDKNSYYADRYSCQNCMFSVKKGERRTITQKELDETQFLTYGYYKIIIHKSGDENKINYLDSIKTINIHGILIQILQLLKV